MVSDGVTVFLADEQIDRSLMAADDGFESGRTADPVQELRDNDNVCGHTLAVGSRRDLGGQTRTS
jgi:hypothetical protein